MLSTSRINRGSTRRPLAAPMAGLAAVVIAGLAVSGAPAVALAPTPQTSELVLDLSAIPGGPAKGPADMDSRLVQLEQIARNDGPAAMRRYAADNAIPLDAAGRPRVLIRSATTFDYGRPGSLQDTADDFDPGGFNGAQDAMFEALLRPIGMRVDDLGGDVVGNVANMVEAHVPVGGLAALRDSSTIGWIEPSLVPRRHVVSQGVAVIGAQTLQNSTAAYRPDRDVRVGVLDLGFKGYTEMLGTELPPSVTVNSFHPGGITGVGEHPLDRVHGTACAEIIHDVAPGAQLFFANFNTLADNDAAVDWLISQQVDVISYSIGWTNAGPGDGTGLVNRAVDRALAAGIQWVGSAGNEARAHWQGMFTDPDNDSINSFAPGDESNAIFLFAGETLVAFLNWDDWFASDQDYDLFILDGAGNIVAGSTNVQNGTQSPTEAAGFTAVTSDTYHVVITRFSASRNVNLELFFSSPAEMQYIVPAGSLTIPADTEGSVAVGATFWGDDVIEAFSSQGPTTDGRVKPDISAPDGVATVSYGVNFGFGFFGTSASAPHTAGAIALMKSRFGVFTLDDIQQILYGRALDRGLAGMDNIYGHGRLDVIGR